MTQEILEARGTMSCLTDWVHSCPLACQDKEALSFGGLQLWRHREQTGKPLGAPGTRVTLLVLLQRTRNTFGVPCSSPLI